jgi:hypothetical protein
MITLSNVCFCSYNFDVAGNHGSAEENGADAGCDLEYNDDGDGDAKCFRVHENGWFHILDEVVNGGSHNDCRKAEEDGHSDGIDCH